jgi:acyl carrier protein
MREQERASGAGLLAQLQGARPSDGGQARVASGDYAAPTNETEEAVAALWEELFGMQRVGANDNFFDLGGNSLLAIQLVSQLRKTFEVELPLSRLFESPTVSGLADAIGEVRVKEQEAEEIARMLQEIEALSLEELQANLAQEAETTKESSLDG